MWGKVQIYPDPPSLTTSKKLSGVGGGEKTERESKAKSIGPNKISLHYVGPWNFYCVIWYVKITYWPHTEQW